MQRPIELIPKSQSRPQVAKPQAQPPRRKITRPEQVGPKLPGKKVEQVVELLAFEPPEVSKVSPPKPQVRPKLEELPEFTAETVEKLQAKPMGIPAEKPHAKVSFWDFVRLRRP